MMLADATEGRYVKLIHEEWKPASAAKIIASDTLEEFAKRLASLHIPIAIDWHAKFGLPKETPESIRPVAESLTPVEHLSPEAEKKSKLACASCGTAVAYNVAKFCWFNKSRFGSNVYCMDCQKTLTAPV